MQPLGKRKRLRPVLCTDIPTATTNDSSIVPTTVSEQETTLQPIDVEKSIDIQRNVKQKRKRNKPSPSIAPESLKCMGNFKAVKELIEHLHGAERSVPVLIYGPVGCGKTHLVEECLKLSHLKSLTIDGAAASGVEELMNWIKSVVQNQGVGSVENILFIDDIEGFIHNDETFSLNSKDDSNADTPNSCYKALMNYLTKNYKTSDSPKIITCTDLFSMNMQIFRQLTEYGCRWEECKTQYGTLINSPRAYYALKNGQRLFTPAQISSWKNDLENKCCIKLKDNLFVRPIPQWKRIRCYPPKNEQITTWFEKKGYPSNAIKHAISTANGDIRKFKNSLCMYFHMQNTSFKHLRPMEWDTNLSSLRMTESLLTLQMKHEKWSEDSSLFDSNRRVLYQNLDKFSNNQADEFLAMDSHADVMDSISNTTQTVKESETFMVLPHFRFHLSLQSQKALFLREQLLW